MDPVAQALAQRQTQPAGARIRDWWRSNLSPDAAVERLWGALPPNVRQTYSTVPNTIAEMSPGAAVRDVVQESGNLSRAAMAGKPVDVAGALAGMTLAALGIVPAGRFGRLARNLPEGRVERLAQLNPGMDKRLADAKAFADQVEAKYGPQYSVLIDPDNAGSVYAQVMRHELKKDGTPHYGRAARSADFKARFADHGSYYGNSISIDPVTQNSLDQALALFSHHVDRNVPPPRYRASEIDPGSGYARAGDAVYRPSPGMNPTTVPKWEDWIKYGLLPPAVAGGMRLTNEVPAAIGHNMGPPLTNMGAPPPKEFKSVFHDNILGDHFANLKEFLPDNFNRLPAAEKLDAAREAYRRYQDGRGPPGTTIQKWPGSGYRPPGPQLDRRIDWWTSQPSVAAVLDSKVAGDPNPFIRALTDLAQPQRMGGSRGKHNDYYSEYYKLPDGRHLRVSDHAPFYGNSLDNDLFVQFGHSGAFITNRQGERIAHDGTVRGMLSALGIGPDQMSTSPFRDRVLRAAVPIGVAAGAGGMMMTPPSAEASQ